LRVLRFDVVTCRQFRQKPAELPHDWLRSEKNCLKLKLLYDYAAYWSIVVSRTPPCHRHSFKQHSTQLTEPERHPSAPMTFCNPRLLSSSSPNV
jgi:hypothetical protein